MLRSSIYFRYTAFMAVFALILTGCEKKEYALPTPAQGLQNDVIKRSLGPNVIGERIEFVYAMGILPDKGKLTSAQVEATIEGATGTFLEHRSFYTNGSGVDVPVIVGSPSVTTGTTTVVTFGKDTSAAALRYYYVVPAAARGQNVSFKFSATASNGETVTFNMGPYKIAKMDMVRNITVSNNNLAYISIENMAVYNSANAAANAAKIDLVYLYRNLTTSAFNHALVSPAASEYLPGVTLPAGVNKSAKIRKEFGLPDHQLAPNLAGALYIDDPDFEKIDLSESPNFAINLKAEASVWVETADGKYRAYIYLNSVNNAAGTAVISIKRFAL
jgi:uncharacterized protein DUF4466